MSYGYYDYGWHEWAPYEVEVICELFSKGLGPREIAAELRRKDEGQVTAKMMEVIWPDDGGVEDAPGSAKSPA